jgi:hypothetical protein
MEYRDFPAPRPPCTKGLTMARKIVNRRELRAEVEAAEAAEKAGVKKAPKKAVKKKAAPRKSRAKKAAVDVQMKAFWGVFNQSLKRVALYEYSQKKVAEKKAVDLSKDGKTPHFVMKVKEAVGA